MNTPPTADDIRTLRETSDRLQAVFLKRQDEARDACIRSNCSESQAEEAKEAYAKALREFGDQFGQSPDALKESL